MLRGTRGAWLLTTALIIGATTVAVGTAPPTASALETYIVTNTSDAPWDGTPGVCSSTAGGACTLRAALEVGASLLTVPDFDDIVVDLTGLPVGSTIVTGSTLDIPAIPGRSIEIRGSLSPGRRVLVQAATPTFGVMRYEGAPDTILTMTGVALTGGGGVTAGGGLFASGGVVLRNVEVFENSAESGGGVHVEGWNLTVDNSDFHGNTATGGNGGGLEATSSFLVVERTSFTGNVATGDGGGVWVSPRATSSVAIGRSTFDTNSAAMGAAILCSCAEFVHELFLENVSVVENSNTIVGSGAVRSGGNVSATNATIADNVGGGLVGTGGSLVHTTVRGGPNSLVDTGDTGFSLTSSIVAGTCVGDPVAVPPGQSAIVNPLACTTTGAGTVITDPPVFDQVYDDSWHGLRTGSGATLPVLTLGGTLTGLAPCQTTQDASGAIREAPCDHGPTESGVVQPPLTFTANAPGDTQDDVTGDGICADASGNCTLRAAVMEANAFDDHDDVVIATPTVALDDVANGTYHCDEDNSARCGDLDTRNDVTISAGPALTVPPMISASVGNVVDFEGSRLTLVGLDLVGAAGEQDGGVVRAEMCCGDALTIRDSRLRGGNTTGAGGGLAADSSPGRGTVALQRVVIEGNANFRQGGGISVTGGIDLTADELTVRNNTGAIGSSGGGIFIGEDATSTITNSLIRANTATFGGGLGCECSLVDLDRVTIAGNTADFGGGLEVENTIGVGNDALRLTNVSVLDNTSSGTGAVHVSGSHPGTAVALRARYTTIAGNQSAVFADAGGLDVDTINSAVVVADSVLAGNLVGGATGECAGPLTTEGVVFGAGCTVDAGPPLDGRDAELGAIVDANVPNDGEIYALTSVPVAAPQLTSPVVDAVACTTEVTVDVLGRNRPAGPACDAGAVEATGISMQLFPSSTAPTAAGASIALADLPPSAVKSKPLANGTLAPSIEAQELQAADLASTPLARIALTDLPLARIALGAAPLARIALSTIPLDKDGGWPAVLEGTPLDGVPLQNVTFGEVVALDPPAPGFAEIALGDLDLTSTPLGSIPLAAIAYANVPLARIDIGGDWCAAIVPNLPADQSSLSCGPGGDIDPTDPDTTLLSISLQGVPLARIPLGSTPLARIDLTDAPLARIPLARIDLAASPLARIPLARIDLSGIDIAGTPLARIPLASIPLARIPLARIPLARIDLAASPLARIPLARIDLAASPLARIPLARIDYASSPLARIPLARIDLVDSPLARIPLARIPLARIASVVDCTLIDCATATLRDAATAGALVAGADLGDLGEYADATLADLRGIADLEQLTLGDLGYYGDAVLADLATAAGFGDILLGDLGIGDLADLIGSTADLDGWPELDAALEDLTIGELLALLPPDVLELLTLGSLLQGVVEPGDYPWEDLDLDGAADELAGDGGAVTFVLDIAAVSQASADYQLAVRLPAGFRYVEGSMTFDGAIRSTSVGPDRRTVDAVLEPRGGSSRVELQALVPLAVGTAGRAQATLTTVVDGNPLTVVADGVDQVVAEAFEVNDTPATATALNPDTLYLTHVATAGDQDWFAVDVAQGERLSLILSNLDVDFDAVLFGPGATRLRGAPEGAVPPAADGGRSLLAQGTVPAVAPLDDIDITPPPDMALVGVSVNRGPTDERIDTTPLDAGRYLVRITGYQDATSARPYALRATLTAPRFSGACPAIQRPVPPTLPDLDTTLPEGMTTLFVVDRQRLATIYPSSDAIPDGGDVTSAVDRLTAAVNEGPGAGGADRFGTEVAGVLDVSSLGGVQAATSAWDASPCSPSAANGVVTAIGAAIDTVVDDHPTIAHIVLVGNDDQIPFARVRDATVYSNERDYAPEVGDAQSPLTAALALGYLLSDDPYADAHPLSVGTRELFVPTVAIGRLVEAPEEIVTALDNYVRFDGRLDPTTALSTGYDFLSDGADSVAAALTANGLTADTLIGDTWTAAELEGDLNAGPDVASVNAHFDHAHALPADQDRAGVQDELYTLTDIGDDTAAGLDGSILFSMGCHAGLSVSDITVGGLRQADWAQTISGLGAVFAGNTGYGYGDDAVVGATEDVMRRFAASLDGTLSVGEAMALAKQQYVAATSVITPFDEKVVSQVVMYGLPQLRIGEGTPVTPPDGPPITTDPSTGLEAAAVSLTAAIDTDLREVTTERGNYWSYLGDTLTTPDQPVQPRAIVDLTQTGRDLRGVLLTGLSSTDRALPDPVYFTPAVDLGATAPEVSTSTTSFPTALQSVSRYDSPTGPRDQAVLIPGQFLGDPTDPGGGGTQRLFTTIQGLALYAPTDGTGDGVAPQISRSVAVVDGGGRLVLRAEVADPDGVELVSVLYTNAAVPGTWVQVLLEPLGDGTFGADVPISPSITAIDFFTQAVDGGNNVARSSNKGEYFRSVPVGPPTITASGPLDASGWYTGPVTVSAAPFAGDGPVGLSVNGTPATGPLMLDADGAYDVVATAGDGTTERAVVRIDTDVPSIGSTTTPTTSPSPGDVEVRLLGVDAGIGVRSLTWSATGAQPSDAVVVDGAAATLRLSAPGTTTVTASAVDALGRTSTSIEVVVVIEPPVATDTDPPVVTCSAPPSGPNAPWSAGDVTVACTAGDTGSGLADPAQASFTLSTSVPDGTATDQAMTPAATVCDVSGNCAAPAGPYGPYRIDRADPTIDVRYPVAGGTVIIRDDLLGDASCTDAGSGVASCTVGTIATSTLGAKSVTATATDAVGNTTTVVVPYTVRYLWSGFYLPILNPPLVNLGKAGWQYPILFNMLDGKGRRIRDVSAVTSITYAKRTSCTSSTFATPVSSPGGVTDALLFMVHAWTTPKQAGCYQLRIALNDGTIHAADFRLV